jgi:hypothetical protein
MELIMKSLSALFVCLALVAFMAGCKDEDTSEATVTVEPVEKLPENLIATTQPAGDVQDVAAAKKSARDGNKVIVRGKVAGSADPLADNRAMLTLLDASVKTCDTVPGDACKTPWDACCEPADTIAANSATVQVNSAQGKPVKATLEGAGGIKPLQQLIVAGTAKKPAGSDALVIEANEIYVVP